MAIVYCVMQPQSREASGTTDTGTASLTYLVRTDDPTEPLVNVYNAPGITYGAVLVDDPTVKADSFTCKPIDDSGLLFAVTWEFARPKQPEPEDGSSSSGEPNPGDLGSRAAFWGAASSVVSGPVFKDINGNIITNSAGDPLEDLQKEHAEHRLTLTQYYETHNLPNPGADLGVLSWSEAARTYTNSLNHALWNGGERGTWKCQGCSAKLNNENEAYYWEVSWEFAYRADGWQLTVWDVGFHQLVDENGDPLERLDDAGSGSAGDGSGSGEETLGTCPDDPRRQAILGQDGKPVRHPVALSRGVAKAPCEEPDKLTWLVYDYENFSNQFGELETP